MSGENSDLVRPNVELEHKIDTEKLQPSPHVEELSVPDRKWIPDPAMLDAVQWTAVGETGQNTVIVPQHVD